jgi:hypothetical protein
MSAHAAVVEYDGTPAENTEQEKGVLLEFSITVLSF